MTKVSKIEELKQHLLNYDELLEEAKINRKNGGIGVVEFLEEKARELRNHYITHETFKALGFNDEEAIGASNVLDQKLEEYIQEPDDYNGYVKILENIVKSAEKGVNRTLIKKGTEKDIANNFDLEVGDYDIDELTFIYDLGNGEYIYWY